MLDGTVQVAFAYQSLPLCLHGLACSDNDTPLKTIDNDFARESDRISWPACKGVSFLRDLIHWLYKTAFEDETQGNGRPKDLEVG